MKRTLSVNLGNLLLSLSDAMDLASPQLAQHQQRTAFIAWEIAKAAGASEKVTERVFIASLLHDAGALSVEDKISLHDFECDDTEPHCIRGELLLSRIPLLSDAAEIVRFHHREFHEWHDPLSAPIVLESQIVAVADYVERLLNREKYVLHQNEKIVSEVISFGGTLFHPEIVELFASVATREEFWLDLVSPRLYSLLLHDGPYRKLEIDVQGISSIASLFRDIVDFRSRFTATHSAGVAASAKILSEIFGLTETEVQLIEVAGHFHDLGKLAIPNSILEKRGKLNKEEFSIIKSHTYFTYSILNTIGELRQIAEWAAFHHEKLDGSGYPFHCTAGELSSGARIMAVADIFTALTEDRPYRKGMSKKEIMRIIKQFSDRALLDTRIINLLFENYDDIFSYATEKQDAARDLYEQQSSYLAHDSFNFKQRHYDRRSIPAV